MNLNFPLIILFLHMCKYAHACSYVQCMCFTVTPAVIDTWKNFYNLQSCHLAQRLSKRYFLCNLVFLLPQHHFEEYFLTTSKFTSHLNHIHINILHIFYWIFKQRFYGSFMPHCKLGVNYPCSSCTLSEH